MTEMDRSGFATLLWLGKAEILILLFGLIGVVTYRILTGAINTRGLLADASGPISPVRVQALFGTFLVAGDCLLHGGKPTLIDGATTQGAAAALAGGSNLIYLIHKYLKS